MGAACGCDGESASVKHEVKQDGHVTPGSKDTPLGYKPQVQGKNQGGSTRGERPSF